MTINPIHPGIIFIIGALILSFIKFRILKQIIIVSVPVIAFYMLFGQAP